MIRVLLADDHALVRAGIRSLLGAMAEVTVVVLSPTRRDSTYVIQHAPQLCVRWALV